MTYIYANLALCVYGQYRHDTLHGVSEVYLMHCVNHDVHLCKSEPYALMGSIDMILLWSIRGLSYALCQS